MTRLPSCRQPRLEGLVAESSAAQARPGPWRLRGLSRSGKAQVGIAVAMLATIAATLGLSQYLQDQMARHLVDKVLASQKLRIQEKVDRFDAILRLAEISVKRYAELLSETDGPLSPPAGAFETTFQRDPDGSWRVPRSRFHPLRNANAWLPPMCR